MSEADPGRHMSELSFRARTLMARGQRLRHWRTVPFRFFFQIFDTELKDHEREVCFIDIAYDEIPERYYKESEVSFCRCECVWTFNTAESENAAAKALL